MFYLQDTSDRRIARHPPTGPEHFGYLLCCHVNDTEEKAQEAGKAFLWRMGHPLRGPREYWAPPGYVSRAAAPSIARHRPTPLYEMSYQELQDRDHLVVGSPENVIRKLRNIKHRLGIGALLLEAQGGPLSHQDTMRSVELLGKEVIPALKD